MEFQNILIPIYSSNGEIGAYLSYPYIFNRMGEWIGWATTDRQVYSVHGLYVGWMTEEPRILRKKSGEALSRQTPPPEPPHLLIPAVVPLVPLLAELSFGVIDVLNEAPELLPVIDFGESREDMD